MSLALCQLFSIFDLNKLEPNELSLFMFERHSIHYFMKDLEIKLDNPNVPRLASSNHLHPKISSITRHRLVWAYKAHTEQLPRSYNLENAC